MSHRFGSPRWTQPAVAIRFEDCRITFRAPLAGGPVWTHPARVMLILGWSNVPAPPLNQIGPGWSESTEIGAGSGVETPAGEASAGWARPTAIAMTPAAANAITAIRPGERRVRARDKSTDSVGCVLQVEVSIPVMVQRRIGNQLTIALGKCYASRTTRPAPTRRSTRQRDCDLQAETRKVSPTETTPGVTTSA